MNLIEKTSLCRSEYAIYRKMSTKRDLKKFYFFELLKKK